MNSHSPPPPARTSRVEVPQLGHLNHKIQARTVETMAEHGRYADIICGDELLWHMSQERVLAGFVTGDCAWPPTFKRVKGSVDAYDLKRIPS